MKKTENFTVAGNQVILTNELARSIQKSVLFYINGRDPLNMVLPFEREMIAENAWFHVLKKSGKYAASKGAKFRTWATTVAKHFASDELEKLLNRDALHLVQDVSECRENRKKSILKRYGNVQFNDDFCCTEDCTCYQYWQDAFLTLKNIVSTYDGRDRTVAEMLISERTKEGMMAETQISSGNVDVCICRIRKKMRADLLRAGYSLAA